MIQNDTYIHFFFSLHQGAFVKLTFINKFHLFLHFFPLPYHILYYARTCSLYLSINEIGLVFARCFVQMVFSKVVVHVFFIERTNFGRSAVYLFFCACVLHIDLFQPYLLQTQICVDLYKYVFFTNRYLIIIDI